MVVSPAAAGATRVVVVAGAVPTEATVAVSCAAPVSIVSTWPAAAPATLATLTFVSPGEAAFASVVLNCRQQESSAAPCAAVWTTVWRGGPEIHEPCHCEGLR